MTHWYEYLIVSPKYFGPNALPVPAINNGSIDSINSVGISGDFHFSKGDNTENLVLYGNYVTGDQRVSIDAWFVPYEHFRMTRETMEKRKTYYKAYYKRQAVGDVILNTRIQLLKKYSQRFQLTLRAGVRMPSGSLSELARYTDGPGYWIDAGHAVPLKNSNWKLLNMLGFYVWQTNDPVLRQNDAFLFGSGWEWNKNDWRLQTYATGYIGYKNDGDKPVLFRLSLEKKGEKAIYRFRFQKGIRDFEYTSLEMGLRYLIRFDHKKNISGWKLI